jgi:endonuclease/exonuclease/phosphatase family metal-dependent hydrolase
MKLISLNVALFEENNDKLKSFIESQNPDILCLQEVTRRVDVEAKTALVSKDAIDFSSSDLLHSFFAPVWVLSKFEQSSFHGEDTFYFDIGGTVEFGNYIRSRFPISKGQNIFVQNHFAYITDWSNWPEEDCRGFQVVDLEVMGKQLRLINYHGIWSKDKKGSPNTQHACEMIREVGLNSAGALIICGDFNLFPGTDSIKVLSQSFKNLCDVFEINSTRPDVNELSGKSRNVVDYIFVNEQVEVNDFVVMQSNVSDHFPLLLDFNLT